MKPDYKGDFVATFEDIDYDLYIKNEITPREAFKGCLFEVYGKDHDFVVKTLGDDVSAIKLPRVDTILEEKGEIFVLNGYWATNRIGYLIRKEIQ